MAPSQAKPKPGDLIEIFRLGYQHWAVYVGDGYVVHLTSIGDIMGAGSANFMSSGSGRAIVKKELLSVVAGKHTYHVNNKHDRKYSPRPPSKIVRQAEELVGQEMLYKLTSDNCEHFVNELRYGVSRSDQVLRAAKSGGVAVAVMSVGTAVGAVVGVALGAPVVAVAAISANGLLVRGMNVMLGYILR